MAGNGNRVIGGIEEHSNGTIASPALFLPHAIICELWVTVINA